MKPMSLNLSKMKKVGGDQHSSTFMHPSGHQITIAHSGVSALQRKQLEGMSVHKMADGGDATPVNLDAPIPAQFENPDAGAVSRSSAVIPHDESKDAPDSYGVDKEAWAKANAAPKEMAPPPAQKENESRAPAASSSPGIPFGVTDFSKAYQQGQQAISEQQKIDEAKSKANLDIQTQDLSHRQDLNKQFQDQLKDFNTHQQQYIQDYMKGHIDPKHYVDSMSTGQKILTGIGLFLGGAGAEGGKNLAYESLQKNIDRDIASQQENIDKKKTLLSANQALYHDNVLALNQTRINMNDMMDHQIQLAASKLGTPQAKANADAAHAKFAMENYALLQQNAMRATVMKNLQSGGQNLNAVDLANAGLIPQAEAAKEQASIDAQKTAIAKTQELYNAFDKEQTAGNFLNPQSSRRVDALKAELVNAVMNASASKRLTHESIKAEIEPLMIKTTDDEKTRHEKEQGLLNIVQRHADPTPYMSRFAPKSLPAFGSSGSNPMEGKTASDSSGNRIVMRNGQWVPYGG